MKRLLRAAALCLLFLPNGSRAAEPVRILDTLTIGTGWFDYYVKHPSFNDDADIRLEHRWGLSLLSAFSGKPSAVDPYFQIHPFAGIETTPRANVYAFGGVILDFYVGRHLVLSPNFAVGYYSQGQGKRLGSAIEFRSTAEMGWRFDGGWRVSAYTSHISNANITRRNPGAEMLGFYIHIPY